MFLCHRVMSLIDADGMANSVDPDQTAPLGTVCPGIFVRKLKIIMVTELSCLVGWTHKGFRKACLARAFPVFIHNDQNNGTRGSFKQPRLALLKGFRYALERSLTAKLLRYFFSCAEFSFEKLSEAFEISSSVLNAAEYRFPSIDLYCIYQLDMTEIILKGQSQKIILLPSIVSFSKKRSSKEWKKNFVSELEQNDELTVSAIIFARIPFS